MAQCPLCGASGPSYTTGATQPNTSLLDPSHALYQPLRHLSNMLLHGDPLHTTGPQGDTSPSSGSNAVLQPEYGQHMTSEWVQTLTHTMELNQADPGLFNIAIRVGADGLKCETHYAGRVILFVSQEGGAAFVKLLTMSERWRNEIARDNVLLNLKFGEGRLVVV